MNDFGTLARSIPLREQIHGRLRTAILNRDYAPGTPLVEAELAARLGASRTPVREALQRLETEGLLERRGARGIVVRQLREEDVVCIFEIRESLESLAARRACRRMSPAVRAELAGTVARMRAAVDDPNELAHLDTAFYDGILAASEGERLRRMLSDLRGELVTWRFLALASRERRVATVAEHAAVLAALELGDEDAVAALVSRHIAEARESVLEHVRQRADELPNNAPPALR
jgi:DNA-binding GntR family transcriptional regulator